jgi:hypothetical protein
LSYKPESLKIRDLIDIVEVYKNSPDIVKILKERKLIDKTLIKKISIHKEQRKRD